MAVAVGAGSELQSAAKTPRKNIISLPLPAEEGHRMIIFRCWYCNKTFAVVEARIGAVFACSCKSLVRVPKQNRGKCKVLRPIDRAIEVLVYGGGGALLGFGLGLSIVAEVPFISTLRNTGAIVAAFTLLGLLFGTFGGERGVNWIGGLIRDREER